MLEKISSLVVKKLNKERTKVIDDGVLVYDGLETDATIESCSTR